MRILSHNVFWFQGVPFATDHPGAPVTAILDRMAACYSQLEPDIICLQELQSPETFEAIADALETTGVYLQGGTLQQYGGGILTAGGTAVGDSSGAEDPAQRVWQVVDVEGEEESDDLRIANLHLPSSRQLGAEASAAKRISEVDDVLAYEPDVIVGDWNEKPGGPLTELMSSRGFVDAAVVSGREDTTSSIGGGRGDQIWVAKGLASRLVGYGAVDVSDFGVEDVEGKTHVSDHLPIWIDLGDLNADV